ncbi:uncharacterized protein T551_00678 [Pneumocystis jirovecii RU7]|uniref:Charged multivesicular body protein 6 n=1 Tax=Pneumocystis jirovecii (strain RU7) TaxID=1408657 RepID=A0A0W4ZUE8_PNEJ7|nr:uncharacterized protein T551_00678 [Pneumocystis jirovecii RU7]KTW31996.1 hypothetical protein T551_00678 [Pneumocystis jirovecii RU7]
MGISYSKKVTKKDYIVLELKLQRDKLHRYQVNVENFVLDTKEAIKKSLAQGNKQKALYLLKQKKKYQELFTKACAHIETVENLISTIEFALIEEDVIYILKQSSCLLKDLKKEMSFESVSKLMDQAKENIIYQNDINNILSDKLEDKDEEYSKEFEELQLYMFPHPPNKEIQNETTTIKENKQNSKQKESSYALLA